MSRLWWVVFSVLFTAAPVRTQDRLERPFALPDIFDTRPIALDPTHFRLIFENDRVQVIRVRLGPHERFMVMEIPAHVMTCTTDQRVRVIHPHGKPVERSEKAGYAGWVERDEYGIENLEEKPAEWILVVPNGPEKSG
jgi:hypothetical protein